MAARTTTVEPSGTGQLRAVVGVFYAGLIVIIIAAVLAGRASSQATAAKTAPQPPPRVTSLNGVPNGIRYRDPHGLFSVVVPKEWQARVESGGGTAGSRSGSFTFTAYTIHLAPPASDKKHAGDAFVVMEYTLPNATARWVECSFFPPAQNNATLAGLPADHLPGQDVWMLDTIAAHYQIDVIYPGGVIVNPGGPVITSPPPTPTPAPAGYLAAQKSLMQHVLASFKPIPAKPLVCP